MFKKSTVFSLHFPLSLHCTLVRSLQSAVRSLRITLTRKEKKKCLTPRKLRSILTASHFEFRKLLVKSFQGILADS